MYRRKPERTKVNHMSNATINVTKEIERIKNLPKNKKLKVIRNEEAMKRAFEYLRKEKNSTQKSTTKATQIRLSGKRVCELFESKKNAYLWVRKDVYESARLKATKELKESGDIKFYIAKYTTKDECFADFERLQEYCNL